MEQAEGASDELKTVSTARLFWMIGVSTFVSHILYYSFIEDFFSVKYVGLFIKLLLQFAIMFPFVRGHKSGFPKGRIITFSFWATWGLIVAIAGSALYFLFEKLFEIIWS